MQIKGKRSGIDGLIELSYYPSYVGSVEDFTLWLCSCGVFFHYTDICLVTMHMYFLAFVWGVGDEMWWQNKVVWVVENPKTTHLTREHLGVLVQFW